MPFWSAAGTSPHWTKILVGLVMCPWTSDGGAFGSVEKKKETNWSNAILKELCHVCLVHFVKNAIYASIFAMKLEKITAKSQLCVKQNISPKHHINRYKRQQMNFEKLLGAQVLKNHNCNPLRIQSSSSLSFVLYLLCHSFLPLTCFLSGYYFTQFGDSSHANVWILIDSARMA